MFYYQGKRFMYSLGDDKTIIPELWDADTMRPINSKSKVAIPFKEIIKKYSIENYNVENELANINQRIKNVEDEIQSYIHNKEFLKQAISFDELKVHLNSIFNSVQKTPSEPLEKSVTLNEYIENFIKGLYSGDITFTTSGGVRKQYRKSSAKVYKEFKTQFDLYQTIIKRNLNFNHIDREFYDAFLKYFSDKDYLTNSIGKQVKCLKAVLSRAYEENIHTNDCFRQKWFKTLASEADNVYLTQSELDMIFDLDLTATPHLDKARDLFLIGCYTTLRVSDFRRLTKEHIVINENGIFFNLFTLKTTAKVQVPIKPLVKSILEKYDYILPSIHEQKLNKYIKEVCLKAGITERVPIKTIKGSKTEINYVPKNEKVTCHTARRTGATLLYLSGADTIAIMKITGHKTEKSFMKYIKISEEENAVRLKDNPFFR